MDELNEEFKVEGKKLLQKVTEIIKKGNVRKITIKDQKGNVVMMIPVNIAVISAVIAPMLAAVGAMAAIINDFTIAVEKEKPDKPK
jgi:predicted regulator of Ras-like GTPase activity (Roadblock/LC7/MglB family)